MGEPRVVREKEWSVAASPAEVAGRAGTFLRGKGHALVPHELCMTWAAGTQLGTRLVGGWFCPPGWLPRRGSLFLREHEAGTLVRARLEESLGFGLLDPMFAEKYGKLLDAELAELEAALR